MNLPRISTRRDLILVLISDRAPRPQIADHQPTRAPTRALHLVYLTYDLPRDVRPQDEDLSFTLISGRVVLSGSAPISYK